MRTEDMKPLIVKATEEFSRQFRGIRTVDEKVEKLNRILSMPVNNDTRKLLTKLVKELTGLKVDPSRELERVRFEWLTAIVYIGNEMERNLIGKVLLVSQVHSNGDECYLIGPGNFTWNTTSPFIDNIRPATSAEIDQFIIDCPTIFENQVPSNA